MISNMMKNICEISESNSFLLSGFQPFEKEGRQQPKAARTFSPLAVGLTADGAFSPSCPCRAGRQLNAMQPLAVGLAADGAFIPSCPCRAGRQLNAMQPLAVGLTADGTFSPFSPFRAVFGNEVAQPFAVGISADETFRSCACTNNQVSTYMRG